MADATSTTADPFEIATAAAIADILAALDETLPVEAELPAPQGEPTEQPATAAPGEAFGHGAIRVRGRSRPSTAPTTTTPDPGPADPAGPVGHGTIRLRGGNTEPVEARAATIPDPGPDPAGAVGPVGHGAIRLRGGTAEPADAQTVAARDEIVAALDTTS